MLGLTPLTLGLDLSQVPRGRRMHHGLGSSSATRPGGMMWKGARSLVSALPSPWVQPLLSTSSSPWSTAVTKGTRMTLDVFTTFAPVSIRMEPWICPGRRLTSFESVTSGRGGLGDAPGRAEASGPRASTSRPVPRGAHCFRVTPTNPAFPASAARRPRPAPELSPEVPRGQDRPLEARGSPSTTRRLRSPGDTRS